MPSSIFQAIQDANQVIIAVMSLDTQNVRSMAHSLTWELEMIKTMHVVPGPYMWRR